MKPLLRIELAMHLEDIRIMTEAEYAILLLHNIWEIECSTRRAGFVKCAEAIGAGRLELMQILPDFQATHPEPMQASVEAPEHGGNDQWSDRQPHTLEVAGSTPASATAVRLTSTVKTAQRVPDRCAV